ncbi:MAG: hypothetical protein KFF77_02905 [Bacteroidetes bacterium]|nr:hypothetical protein [Bacteroidota bacterium]
MTPTRRIVLIVLMMLGSSVTTLHAQFRSDVGAPAAPPPGVLSPDPSQWWIGPQIGASLTTHPGDFITEFCNCAFEDGSGAGIAVGIELGHKLSPLIGIALKAMYNDFGADYSYKIIQETWVVELNEFMPAEHERRNRIDLGYFMLHPALQIHPFSGLYVFLGPAVGINTTGTTSYSLLMTDERYMFDPATGNADDRTIEEDSGEIPGLESLRLDFRFGAGADFRLGRSFVISPEVSYNLPLTTISSDDNWKAQAIHLIAVFKFEL